ncbi:EamA family transporter, partial [Candidatus Gottesmanbacteria bacterium]|nr:EamA family transporter [Candidatus Gottesmanbacteria bacterium]
MRKINYPILALIIANIIWGATSPIIKFSLANIPPMSLAFIRFLLAAFLLYPFIHKKINYFDLKIKWLWIYTFGGITVNII